MTGFYSLTKEQRKEKVEQIQQDILRELQSGKTNKTSFYFEDEYTYIRKAAYEAVGKLYKTHKLLQPKILRLLRALLLSENFKVRQTAINAAGEIGKTDFNAVQQIFDTALFDIHRSPRNAVIGSVKKMGEINPKPVMTWALKYLHHEDKEIRREICHGIELRGRKHPEDILPLLKELQHDKTARVRNTLVHVIGQIAYKKGCIEKVVEYLKTWDNKKLVDDALEEIIDVHHRYRNFSALTQDEARKYILSHFH